MGGGQRYCTIRGHLILDDSIAPGPGVIPYNSTFWFKGVERQLDAPFLRIGTRCPPHNNFFTSFGSCVCYRGSPITYDWFSNDNMLCVGSRNYIWGFSAFLTMVGLAMESAWALGCWAMWLDANVNSKLLKHRRTGAGVIRSVLDLAESINRDLGDSTCVYCNKELEKSLDIFEHIGYSVDRKGDGVRHIGIVGESQKRREELNEFELYGRFAR